MHSKRKESNLGLSSRYFKGQSLFELIFAMAVVIMIIVGVVSLAGRSVRNESFSQNQSLASEYAQQAVEWIRGYRDTDWDVFKSRSAPGAGNEWCINSLPPLPLGAWSATPGACAGNIANTILQRTIILADDAVEPATVVHVTVIVSWTDTQGFHEVRSVTRLTNWNR